MTLQNYNIATFLFFLTIAYSGLAQKESNGFSKRSLIGKSESFAKNDMCPKCGHGYHEDQDVPKLIPAQYTNSQNPIPSSKRSGSNDAFVVSDDTDDIRRPYYQNNENHYGGQNAPSYGVNGAAKSALAGGSSLAGASAAAHLIPAQMAIGQSARMRGIPMPQANKDSANSHQKEGFNYDPSLSENMQPIAPMRKFSSDDGFGNQNEQGPNNAIYPYTYAENYKAINNFNNGEEVQNKLTNDQGGIFGDIDVNHFDVDQGKPNINSNRPEYYNKDEVINSIFEHNEPENKTSAPISNSILNNNSVGLLSSNNPILGTAVSSAAAPIHSAAAIAAPAIAGTMSSRVPATTNQIQKKPLFSHPKYEDVESEKDHICSRCKKMIQQEAKGGSKNVKGSSSVGQAVAGGAIVGAAGAGAMGLKTGLISSIIPIGAKTANASDEVENILSKQRTVGNNLNQNTGMYSIPETETTALAQKNVIPSGPLAAGSAIAASNIAQNKKNDLSNVKTQKKSDLMKNNNKDVSTDKIDNKDKENEKKEPSSYICIGGYADENIKNIAKAYGISSSQLSISLNQPMETQIPKDKCIFVPLVHKSFPTPYTIEEIESLYGVPKEFVRRVTPIAFGGSINNNTKISNIISQHIDFYKKSSLKECPKNKIDPIF